MKLDQIRERFLDYFKRRGHEIVPSSSLVPEGDPTLLFTNAGMNQFKDVFLGREKRPYSRAATAQKCFRASGKHNDLENVGHTSRHHTFFEMLGNFSFGDYFKAEAIHFAWEFVTSELGLPPEQLWITIFREDDEAFELWQKVAGVPPQRIVRLGEKDNFWSMGEVGPCGPCSEIHIDQGPHIGCGRPECGVECDCDRFLELWNLVFMQFERDAAGRLTPLPKPSIDTGMGLERIAAVIQGKYSNYDTDLFSALLAAISDITSTPYPSGSFSDVSLRVIADHARAMTCLIADGVLPSNEGRGYVLRRIMRRAARHAKMVGQNEPVLFRVSEVVVELMGEAYPELSERRAFVAEVIRNEEERFLETLDAGLKILQEEIAKITGQVQKEREEATLSGASSPGDITGGGQPGAAKGILSGELAFKLYDTYGFPLDLTQNIAAEEGLTVDVAGFEQAMERQRQESQKHWKGSGEEEVNAVYKELASSQPAVEFLGYKTLRASAQVRALLCSGELVDRITETGADFQLIADRTPFYGESGGQVGDTGIIRSAGAEIEVLDTKRPVEGLIVHHCRLLSGALGVGESVTLEVNGERRADIARNHSATHLLQAALRLLVGKHVHQKGSLVSPDRFRFDLTHFSPITGEQLQAIENQVNAWIRENHPVNIQHLPYKDAVKKGAMALFGEKYEEMVRMIEIGEFSRELCGGTHTRRTGDIGLFKIVTESSVAAGVRRIEAVTGRTAVRLVQEMEARLQEAAGLLKAPPEELLERLQKLQEEIRTLKKELKSQRSRPGGGGADLYAKVKEMNGIKVLITEVEVQDPKELRPLADQLKDKFKSVIALLGSRAKGKAHLLAAVTPDLTARIKAGELVAHLAPLVGGKGGGRPDFAQAGGPEAEKLGQALQAAEKFIQEKLGL